MSVRAPFGPVDWSGVLTSVPTAAGGAAKGAEGDCGCGGSAPQAERKLERVAPRGAGRGRPGLTPGRVRRGAEGLPEGDKKPAWLGGIDYGLSRVWEEREGGVPTCVVISPLNFGAAESEHASGPDCRTGSVRTGDASELGSFGIPGAIPPGGYGFSLPTAYRAVYPSSRYPYDDPAAEWMYFRSKNNIGQCLYYSGAGIAEYQDDLVAVAMLPYLTYEVLSSGYLDTPAGYLRPQIVVRFVMGMIVSISNVDDGLRSEPNTDDGHRLVELFSRVALSEASIRTYRRDAGRWVGQERTRRYETCAADETLGQYFVPTGDSSSVPSREFCDASGGSRSAAGVLMEGVVLVTETADRSFLDFGLIGEMVRTGFSCLVGDRVEYEYSVQFTGAGDSPVRVSVSRCLGEADLERLCSFLERVDELQDGDEGHLVLQQYDNYTLWADSSTC